MPRPKSKITLLENIPLFSGCSKKDLKRIAQICTELPVDKGTVLAEEGKPGREFFVIASGKARVTRQEATIGTLGEGDFFGELALLDPGPRKATVTAVSDMGLYILNAREFITLINEHPSVAIALLRGVARRIGSGRRAAVHQ